MLQHKIMRFCAVGCWLVRA